MESSCALIRRLLNEVAPDVEFDAVDPAEMLNDRVGLDSLDFVRLMDLIRDESGIDISVLEYSSVGTIDGLIAHLDKHRWPGVDV